MLVVTVYKKSHKIDMLFCSLNSNASVLAKTVLCWRLKFTNTERLKTLLHPEQ